MSNIVSPPQFQQFPAPYRIQVVRERLQQILGPKGFTVDIEPLVVDAEPGFFPHQQYDSCRVFARKGAISLNVAGLVSDQSFEYQAYIYDGNSPLDGHNFNMGTIDALVMWASANHYLT